MNAPQKLPSAFPVEWQKFHMLLRRSVEHWLNEFFDLSMRGPVHRARLIHFLFLGLIALNLIANLFPILSHLGTLLPAVLTRNFSGVDFLQQALFIATLIAYICIPFFLTKYFSLEMASDYLADVFELNDVNIARRFIQQLSLDGSGFAVHVRGGKIVDADLESPLVKIGGPGRVVVEFDSAVLFEKADGRPHIIGPTQRMGYNLDDKNEMIDVAILDGFERFREAIDLRDHYIGTPAGEGMTIKGLSLDGLPISATDVRAVYSVRRSEDGMNKAAPSKELPYPYSKKAIEDIVYQSTARVLTGGPHPSDHPSAWTNTAQGLIRGAISEFMSENNLSEYLASFGAPEVEQAETQERTIQFQRFEVTSNTAATTNPPQIQRPEFHPRTELSGIFRQLDRFVKHAHDRGVDLHWIGVGTWKIPDKIASEMVTDQHIRAWQINRENVERGSQDAFAAIYNEAYVDQKLHLIQKVPVGISRQNEEQENNVRRFIMAYWDLLGEAADLYYNAGDPLPKELHDGIAALETLIFHDQHYVDNRPPSKLRVVPNPPEDLRPPAPSTHTEHQLYTRLLHLLDGDYRKAEWLIEYESKKAPSFSREQIIRHLLDHPELCKI